MRRFLAALVVLTVVPALHAKDVYLSIAGSVGVFRTDTRIVNPSTSKDITITAVFYPAGNPPGAPITRTITLPKRQQAVYDDVVSSLFQSSGLGGIKLSSPDDFVATQRIYSQGASGTSGQFVLGQDSSAAKKKGLVPQMKSSGARGVVGTFRTNIGFLNPNGVAATVNLRLYDKNNAVISRAEPLVLQPNAVVTPTEVSAFFGSPSNDLRDEWVSFESDQPIFAYGSVVDNGTEDPTFIPAQDDSGVIGSTPTPGTKTFNVVASQFQFSISGDGSEIRARVGDTIVLRISSDDVTHGFAIQPPYASVNATISPGSPREFRFEATEAGTFEFRCTVTSCGSGHDSMVGTMTILGNEGPVY